MAEHRRGERPEPCIRCTGDRGCLDALIDERLIDHIAQQRTVVSGLRPWNLRHPYRDQLFLRIDPECGAGCAYPVELSLRSRQRVDTTILAHRETQSESISPVRRR